MKNKILSIIILSILTFSQTFAEAPTICSSLIGCGGGDEPLRIISDFIGEFLKYTAVIAVMAVMISGIYYLISMGEEEKTKKAKKGVIWSMVGVIISVSAWYIIHSINNLHL